MENPPLVIDLDQTLLRADLAVEASLASLRAYPQRVFAPLRRLVRGEDGAGQQPARDTSVDAASLPYNELVIDLIKRERGTGRTVTMVTCVPLPLANRIAEHLSLFDRVISTSGHSGSVAKAKREMLLQAYGPRGFDYAGNGRDDLPVREIARRVHLVEPTPSVRRRALAAGNTTETLARASRPVRDWLKAVRLHQWLKNLLVFVPLLAAHRYTELPLVGSAVLSFLAFGLCASSVYVLNDLMDLQDDRLHATKRFRPFASGRISVKAGFVVFPLLLLAAFGLAAWLLPWGFVGVLALYYLLTLAYSLELKRRMMLDVITLAGLYTLRIIAGAVGLSIPLSFWLLALSMFMFLSLALVKRYAELFQVRAVGSSEKARGRGYFPDDLQMISSLGAASGYIAVMVLALYINDAHTADLYGNVQVIWLACPLLLTWISRVWMLTHRGFMNEDPVIFAVRDRISLVIGASIALVFWMAT